MPESKGARVPEGSEECEGEDTCRNDEPPMYMERPSSARSQDVTHILVRTFRELFTRDTIASDTIQYLNTSRCSEDEYHQQYVDDLLKVTVLVVYRGLNVGLFSNICNVFLITALHVAGNYYKRPNVVTKMYSINTLNVSEIKALITKLTVVLLLMTKLTNTIMTINYNVCNNFFNLKF